MRRFFLLFVILICMADLLSACGTDAAMTDPFVTANFATALAATNDGGLEYAIGNTGQVYAVDKNGRGDGRAIGSVQTLKGDSTAVTGLAIDGSNRSFAAWIDGQSRLTVGQIAPGPTRILWQGPVVPNQDVAGRLAVSPDGRLVLSVGNLDTAVKEGPLAPIIGKVLSLDPNGASTQLPNPISSNWDNPTGLAYSADNVLWIADDNPSGKGRFARADTNGPTGTVTYFNETDHPIGLTAYGQQEMAVCLQGNHQLKRYLLSDGIQALPGRVLANDCEYGVTQLKDGRLAYATTTGIRVTVL